MDTNANTPTDNGEVTEEELFDDAVKEAEKSPDAVEVQLSSPIKYEGKTLKNLTFDFGKLTGADGIAIENELAMMGKTVFLPSASIDYLIRAAARSCVPKIGIDAFSEMTLKDFNLIRSKVRNFLMKSL